MSFDAPLSLRVAHPEDFEALARLAVACADTGRIRAAPKYLRSPVLAWAALKPQLEWVVAEAGCEVIGAAQVIFSETVVEGERRPCACLASLMVDPAYRRRGMARALTEWRLERAGPDAVVVAAIQTGNVGSLANARHWATQIFGTLVLPVLRAGGTRSRRYPFEVRHPARGAGVGSRGYGTRGVRAGLEPANTGNRGKPSRARRTATRWGATPTVLPGSGERARRRWLRVLRRCAAPGCGVRPSSGNSSRAKPRTPDSAAQR